MSYAPPPIPGAPPGYSGGAPSGIEVSLSFFPLAFLLFMCTPQVEINGQARPFSWGTHFIPLPPGRYHVRIFFAYMFYSECGMNSSLVDIMPGQVRKVSFYMWPLMFLPGSLSVE